MLLRAFMPAEPRSERATGYRQWRLLRGEQSEDVGGGIARQEITPAQFDCDHLLGEGNYSQVIGAMLKSTQQRVALKVIDKSKVKRYKKEDEVLVERWVLRNMRHPSIVDMYHAFQEVQALYLSLEMCPGGELWALTHRCGLPAATASFYGAQMLEVLQFLHERDVVHRDLKPENVLLTMDAHIKVIDFGTAKLLRHPIKLSSDEAKDNSLADDRRGKFKEFVGTPEYMSPEAINNKFTTQRADLWSFGAFIAQITTGQPIFKGGSDYLTFKRVLARSYQLIEGTPAVVADLVEKLCVLEPKQRLGGKWSTEADATDPSSLVGTEPRTLGHAALRAHPFFAGLPASGLHLLPVPHPTEEEKELNDMVRRIAERGVSGEFGATAAERAAAVAGWSDEYKRTVGFEVGKRSYLTDPPLLSDELRDILGMGPRPPPIVDDLTEELAARDKDDDDDDEPPPAAAGDEAAGGGTVV